MKLKNAFKIILSFCLLVIMFALCACSGGFKIVEPPVNEFPTVNEYVLADVITGDFVVEKNFRGNYNGEGLYTTSTTLLDSGFYIGEKGTVTYVYNNETIKLDATIEKADSTKRGGYIAKHQILNESQINMNWPGEFSIITFQKENCVLVPKSAVWLFDDEGNGKVYTVDENEILVEKQIKVGPSNNKYYQVVEGITPGEKVVLK